MAEIRPFRGLRFSADAGPIDALTAPPYDVLTPAERDEYAVRNPHNIVHLTLPEQKPDDRSKFVRYARSAAQLSEWRRDGVLVPEEKPAFYRLVQSFSFPRVPEAFHRTALVTLLKVEPYSKGVVLPHEQTFPKHKEDRLRILEATRAHLESIFGLFEDPDGAVQSALANATIGAEVTTRSDDGVTQRLAPITDPGEIQNLVNLLADKKVWIADGHHRYETALAFREAVGEAANSIPEDFLLISLTSLNDPGLVLLPTHRIVSNIPVGDEEALVRLGGAFEITETHSRNLVDLIAQSQQRGVRAFGMALEGGRGFVLVPRDDAALVANVPGEGSAALKSLDVTILHSVILEQLLGVQGLDGISYTRESLDAIHAADQGEGVAFLMNPPTVEDMKVIALAGERMPQKSTYYFPKILSGLVLWSLNDFE